MRIPVPFAARAATTSSPISATPTVRRPDPAAPDAAQAFHDYVYLRDNPSGLHQESGITAAAAARGSW